MKSNPTSSQLEQLLELSAALDQAAITLMLDRSFVVKQINEKHMLLSGYLETELLGKSLSELLCESISIDLVKAMYDTLRQGSKWTGELAHKSKKGQVFWTETNIIPILGKSSQVDSYRTIAFDITERKAIEQSLGDSKAFSKAMLESAPVGFFLANQAGDCTYINQKWTELSGYRLRRAAAGGWIQAVHPQDRERVSTDWSNFISVGIPFNTEFRYIHPDGRETWVLSSAIRLLTGQESLFTFLRIEHDITGRKASEKLVDEHKAKIIASSKMSELGEMAGGIAHEINNPLAVIMGKASQIKEMSKAGTLDPTWLEKAIDKIESTAARIAKIVRALRNVARDGERDPFQYAALASMIEDSLEMCSARFKNNEIALVVEPYPAELQVSCRPVQICQVLVNILNNALHAVEALPEKWVKLSVHDLGEFIEIRVTDSGKGIPLEHRELLFRPFFTTKPFGSGTGLGLSVSRGILESHRGTLTLDGSCPNTRFVIKLLKHQPKEQTASEPAKSAA